MGWQTTPDADAFLAGLDAGPADTDDRMSHAPSVDDRLDEGRLVVWKVDGVPVSFAGRTRLIAGMIRIAPVYTAPPMRRAGFGAAVTAEITRAALATGAEHVVLFTDLTNPTSNALYQRLGDREVACRVELSPAA